MFQIEVPWTGEITFSQVQLFEPLALWAIRCSVSLSHPAGMPLTGDFGESWLQQIVPKRVVLHSRAGMCKRGFPISRAKSYNPQMTERTIRLSSLIHTKKKTKSTSWLFWGGGIDKNNHMFNKKIPLSSFMVHFPASCCQLIQRLQLPPLYLTPKGWASVEGKPKKRGSEVVLCWTYIVTSRKWLDNGYGALVV